METLQAKIADLRLRVVAGFQASPGRAWFLTVMLTILLVMVGRLALKGGAPAIARAAHPPTPAAKTDESLPIGAASGPSIPLSQWARHPIQPMGRDLFCIPFDYYPQPDGTHTPGGGGDGLWDQLGRSMSSQADATREHQVLVDNLRTQAANLKLQGIVMGAAPAAWINGTLVTTGQMIGITGFRLVSIAPRRIVVERQGVQLAIEMK